jgi:branched-chain amino acid transport system ATP-binding protein
MTFSSSVVNIIHDDSVVNSQFADNQSQGNFSMSKLHVEKIRKNWGGLAALAGVSLQVESGARQAIIGPNGAGKSTLFNIIAGEIAPTAGKIFLNDQDVTALPVHARANLGLGHTFQRNNLFMGLTVLENVLLAVQHHRKTATQWFQPARAFAPTVAESAQLLERVGLADVRDKNVNVLAYGQQRALEIALALAGEPSVLLLDEPTAGMSPAETHEITRLIETLPRTLTILIVEHDMDVVFTLAERITVLHYGQVIAEGAAEQVKTDPRVLEVYLGVADAERSKKIFVRE